MWHVCLKWCENFDGFEAYDLSYRHLLAYSELVAFSEKGKLDDKRKCLYDCLSRLRKLFPHYLGPKARKLVLVTAVDMWCTDGTSEEEAHRKIADISRSDCTASNYSHSQIQIALEKNNMLGYVIPPGMTQDTNCSSSTGSCSNDDGFDCFDSGDIQFASLAAANSDSGQFSFYMTTQPLFKEFAQLADSSTKTGNGECLAIANTVKNHLLEAIAKMKTSMAGKTNMPTGMIISCSQTTYDASEHKHKKQRRN
jgi:hypothetical protein